MEKKAKGRILFFGHSFYHNWYLSRELRKLGWKADLVNIDSRPENQLFYHGQDIQFQDKGIFCRIVFYLKIFFSYDILHFSNRGGIGYFWFNYSHAIFRYVPKALDIKILKLFGKKIVYTNNGCNDGMLQTTWGSFTPSPCEWCVWKKTKRTDVCSDERNRSWAVLRNTLADCQFLTGGYFYDFNNDNTVLEAPGAYCLDHNFWNPDILIPSNYRLNYPNDTVKIYHAVGNFESRTNLEHNTNIKATHIYLPLIERYKKEGLKVELLFFHNVPNKELRYYQAQCDIVVDMLTFGCFGANVREALMLGKPVVCYMRPAFIEKIRQRLPEYADELPVVSATPDTVYDVLKELILSPEKRKEIGRRSREFAVKWHSAENAAKKMEQIYSSLLNK
ncbi:MAG TPA: glycosyltransferase [Chitinophagales bacterium]|nr:glycosyltransferase [Chitinophagales bacterium]